MSRSIDVLGLGYRAGYGWVTDNRITPEGGAAADAMPKMFAFLSQRLRAGPFYGGEKLNLADLTVFAVVDPHPLGMVACILRQDG